MRAATSPSSGKPYGMARVCRVWGAARATVYRRRVPARPEPRRRPGPVGPMPDAGLLERIRGVLSASPFHGEGHRKVWARLRFAGLRTSRHRVLRLMREHGLLAPSRVGSPRGPRNHDGTIIPETIDTMWGTDMTTTWTREGQVAVFIAVDHHNAECVGVHAARHGTRFEALEPIRQGVRRHFGAFAKGVASGLSIRHDHGSQYMSAVFQDEIAFLGRRKLARLRAGARGQRLRRALHPHAQGEPALGAQLRHRRGPASRAAGLQGHLQHHVADRAARTPHARRRPERPAFTRGNRRLGSSSVSQYPGPVQQGPLCTLRYPQRRQDRRNWQP